MTIDQIELNNRVQSLMRTHSQQHPALRLTGHNITREIAIVISAAQEELKNKTGDKSEAEAHITAALEENANFRPDFNKLFTSIATAEQIISQLPNN